MDADWKGSGCSCCSGTWSWIGALIWVLVLPLLFIWALDTLFGFGIAYNPFTWFASLIVVTVLSRKGWKCWSNHSWCPCSIGHKM